jgi:hypothetical protein
VQVSTARGTECGRIEDRLELKAGQGEQAALGNRDPERRHLRGRSSRNADANPSARATAGPAVPSVPCGASNHHAGIPERHPHHACKAAARGMQGTQWQAPGCERGWQLHGGRSARGRERNGECRRWQLSGALQERAAASEMTLRALFCVGSGHGR